MTAEQLKALVLYIDTRIQEVAGRIDKTVKYNDDILRARALNRADMFRNVLREFNISQDDWSDHEKYHSSGTAGNIDTGAGTDT